MTLVTSKDCEINYIRCKQRNDGRPRKVIIVEEHETDDTSMGKEKYIHFACFSVLMRGFSMHIIQTILVLHIAKPPSDIANKRR